jgi:hypothetical protein
MYLTLQDSLEFVDEAWKVRQETVTNDKMRIHAHVFVYGATNVSNDQLDVLDKGREHAHSSAHNGTTTTHVSHVALVIHLMSVMTRIMREYICTKRRRDVYVYTKYVRACSYA